MLQEVVEESFPLFSAWAEAEEYTLLNGSHLTPDGYYCLLFTKDATGPDRLCQAHHNKRMEGAPLAAGLTGSSTWLSLGGGSSGAPLSSGSWGQRSSLTLGRSSPRTTLP